MALLIVGCGSNPEPPIDTDTDDPRDWEVLLEDLPGAVLSIWGTASTDVWVTGSSGGSGTPTIAHSDGTDWDIIDPGLDGNLWWVTGSTDDAGPWFVGAEGLIIRHDAGDFTTIPAVTDATLFGAYTPPDGPLVAVGGHVADNAGGVIVMVDGDVATLVTDLPAEVPPTELFFKAWGVAADNLWVIGDQGSLLHFDGATWTWELLPGSPRSVTMHGTSVDDRVIVGGSANGVILHGDAEGWTDVSPERLMPLNGVFVAADGVALATGFSSSVMERVDGQWSNVEAPPVRWDWHGAWIDEDGAYYAVGGNLMSLVGGTVVRYR